jgi:hypothetical protein
VPGQLHDFGGLAVKNAFHLQDGNEAHIFFNHRAGKEKKLLVENPVGVVVDIITHPEFIAEIKKFRLDKFDGHSRVGR